MCQTLFASIPPAFIELITWGVAGLGTGSFALLALFAARAGARRVFAVEVDPDAAELARASVANAVAPSPATRAILIY